MKSADSSHSQRGVPTTAAATCPSDGVIEAFAGDQPVDSEVRRHIGGCEPCQQRALAVAANNRLLGELRRFRGSGSGLSLDRSAPALPLVVEGYDILGEIKHGGQGIVYRAVQRSTRRTVALKVLLRGTLAGARQRLRFDREIDLVAGLRHPNIVTVFDSGRTPDGRHFLVMEYIEGVSFTEWVRGSAAGRPDFKAILRLFAAVCEGVNYAHQRGVIHRDIKPGNILVDDEGRPHVVDFGLAKAVGQQEPESGAVTLTGDFVGTLAYAAPEQVAGRPEDVDIRSDVYALGVMLYEALTGQTPYPVSGPMADVIHHISDTQPQLPSRQGRLRRRAAQGDYTDEVNLDDEIGTILLKALAKDKDRRYQTAEALARDVENYLAGRPIDAKRDNTWYGLRKAIRRHRIPVAAAVLFVAVLIGFSVTMSVLYRRAEQQTAKATRIKDVLKGIFASADPASAHDMTVQEALDQASGKIDQELADQPDVLAEVYDTLCTAYYRLGKLDSAESLARKALALCERHFPGRTPQMAQAVNNLGVMLVAKRDLASAEPLLQRALSIFESRSSDYEEKTAHCLLNLGIVARLKRQYPEAEALYRRALEIQRKLLPRDHEDVAVTLNNLANVLSFQKKPEAAEPLAHEALAIRVKQRGPDHPDVAQSLMLIGLLRQDQGDLEGAEPLLRDALDIRRRKLPASHPDLASVLNNLAFLLQRLNNNMEGMLLYTEALRIRRESLPANHPYVGISLHNLADVLLALGDSAAAEPLYREALQIRLAGRSPNELELASTHSRLGDTLLALARPHEAEEHYRQALATRRRTLPVGARETWLSMSALGGCLLRQGCLDEAAALLTESFPQIRLLFGEADLITLDAARRMAELYETLGNPQAAAPFRAMLLDPKIRTASASDALNPS